MTSWHPGPTSQALFARAQNVIPGGVNSPVRAFGSVGGEPYFVARADGPYVWDSDGNRYIDYIGSWGPLILGHADPEVTAALTEVAARGTSFGAPCALEVELAELVTQLVPSIEVVRLVNSGTEATMSAVRLARAHTGRSKIIKFAGCYHGHADLFLIKAGSGAATLGQPDSPGVTPATAADTLIARYNDIDSVARLFEKHKREIAAVIVEPVAGNMGCVPPDPGFLEGLRSLCDVAHTVLIFDEVMTGFRVAPGGAQQRYGITPDLTTLGKIIGGGLPVGAYGGKRAIMNQVAPAGPVYQAGTLSGNPLAMVAGLTTLRRLQDRPELYDTLELRSKRLADGIARGADEARVPLTLNRVGSMLSFFALPGPVRSWDDVAGVDRDQFARLFQALLQRGISIAPSPFEAMFVSLAHTEATIDATVAAFAEAWLVAADRQ